MRISDWSSDVCSSDLGDRRERRRADDRRDRGARLFRLARLGAGARAAGRCRRTRPGDRTAAEPGSPRTRRRHDLFRGVGGDHQSTDREQRVPPILAELRDAQGTIVYSWTIKPPVRMLPPNEKVNFSEAKLDIPRRATQLTVSWALPKG